MKSEFDIRAKIADTELAIARTQKAIDARPGTYALLLTRRAYDKRLHDLWAVINRKSFNLSSDPDIVVDTMAAFYHADIRELTGALTTAMREWNYYAKRCDRPTEDNPKYRELAAIRDKHCDPAARIGD